MKGVPVSIFEKGEGLVGVPDFWRIFLKFENIFGTDGQNHLFVIARFW